MKGCEGNEANRRGKLFRIGCTLLGISVLVGVLSVEAQAATLPAGVTQNVLVSSRIFPAVIIMLAVGVVIFLIRNRGLLKKSNNDSQHSDMGGFDFSWVPRALVVMFLDILIVVGAYLLALMLRFDFSVASIPAEYFYGYRWSIVFWVAATVVLFYAFKLYHSIWRLASIPELVRSVEAYVVLIPIYAVGVWFLGLHMPRSYYFMGYVLCFLLTTGMRIAYRVLKLYTSRRAQEEVDVLDDRIMVIGGGTAGQVLIKDLLARNDSRTKVCCIIDDNPSKRGRMLEGVPIVGDRNDILEAVKTYYINHIIYAIPATTGENRKEILNICKETDCKLQTIPSISQLVNGEVSVQQLRDVDITDLLGRAQVRVNDEEIRKAIEGQVILVTGGGGSIGSELCRQIAKAGPKQLIIFDIYENNAYDIQQELKDHYPDLNFEVLIGSVRNTNRVSWMMEHYHPDVIFHAAAHKHVPLMEESPNEAIKNNVIGTCKMAEAAARYGVKRFVLISTDKAVNPTNIMGASKRLCEMVVQMMNRRVEGTDYVAVRFGNVLGSNGSVIPLFKRQIAEGGPVTVTDKNIIRYFMTIPEAVSLVLQAYYYAKGGEIFVLDMGDPVKIDDMARNLIRLSGLTPDVDIEIVYTGLRPGEKLFEELLMDEEGLTETDNELIYIGNPIEMDDEWFIEQLKRLDAASRAESEDIKEIVAGIVPTYHVDQH